jgi:hypothetical protein
MLFHRLPEILAAGRLESAVAAEHRAEESLIAEDRTADRPHRQAIGDTKDAGGGFRVVATWLHGRPLVSAPAGLRWPGRGHLGGAISRPGDDPAAERE